MHAKNKLSYASISCFQQKRERKKERKKRKKENGKKPYIMKKLILINLD